MNELFVIIITTIIIINQWNLRFHPSIVAMTRMGKFAPNPRLHLPLITMANSVYKVRMGRAVKLYFIFSFVFSAIISLIIIILKISDV